MYTEKMNLTAEEKYLIDDFRKLNAAGKAAASEKLNDYTAMNKYTATEEQLREAEEQLRAKIAEVRRISGGSTRAGFEFTFLDLKAIDALSGDRWELMNNALQYGFFSGYNHAKAESAATL